MIFFEFYHKEVLDLYCNILIYSFINELFGKEFFKKINEGCISL